MLGTRTFALTLLVLATTGSAAHGNTRVIDVSAHARATFVGEVRDFGSFGFAANSLGDVDGDGTDDLGFGYWLRRDAEGGGLGAVAVSGRSFDGEIVIPRRGADVFSVGHSGLGIGLRGAGDVNGDGIGDLLADGYNDETFVIFGQRSPAEVNFAQFDRGFVVESGDQSAHYSGGATAAGDVNGDGRGDLLLSTVRDDGSGYATVVFGSDSTASIDSSAPGSRGYRIENFCNGIVEHPENGEATIDIPAGFALGAPGDFNGDGLADLAIGLDRADRLDCQAERRGEVLIMFGQRSTENVDAQRTDARVTFQGGKGAGSEVVGATDVNGDSLPDLLTRTRTGVAVLFGGAKPGRYDLAKLGTRGLLVRSAAGYDASPGRLGDFNGDRLNDFTVGNHVVYGSRSTQPVDLGRLGVRGVRILETGSVNYFSAPDDVADGGDPDGDGRAAVLVEGAPFRGRDRAYLVESKGPPRVLVAPYKSSVKVSGRRALTVRVLCPGNAFVSCAGTVRIRVRGVTLLRRRFRARSGLSVRVRQRLSPRALRAVRRSRDRRAVARGFAQDGRGASATTHRLLRLR